MTESNWLAKISSRESRVTWSCGASVYNGGGRILVPSVKSITISYSFSDSTLSVSPYDSQCVDVLFYTNTLL